MKNPDRKTVSKLDQLPNIGQAIAAHLLLIGIEYPQQLIGKDPFILYEILCKKTGTRYDPCIIDVFMSAVDFMQGGEVRLWWSYTEQRKNSVKQRNKDESQY